jgi:hypothetical protein
LGLFRRDDGAIMLAIANQNASEDATGLTPIAVLIFPTIAGAVETRTGALVRLGKQVGADGFVAGLSVGQVVAAIKSEAAALDVDARFYRVTIAPENPAEAHNAAERNAGLVFYGLLVATIAGGMAHSGTVFLFVLGAFIAVAAIWWAVW